MDQQENPTTIRRSLWQQTMDAIRGTDADYTRIDLKKAIFLLAVPMILELVMESTFAVVGHLFCGATRRFCGSYRRAN